MSWCNSYYTSFNCEFFYLIVIGIPVLVMSVLGVYFCYRRQQVEKHRPPANEMTPTATVPTASPVLVHSQQYDLNSNGTTSYVVQDAGHFYGGDKASA